METLSTRDLVRNDEPVEERANETRADETRDESRTD